jgi:hypothetical protein
MKLLVQTEPHAYSVCLLLSEDERLALVVGTEAEARTWRQRLLTRLAESSTFTGLKRLKGNLTEAGTELEALRQTEGQLKQQIRAALEQGASVNGLEKKLKAARADTAVVTERIAMLEAALTEQTKQAFAEVRDAASETLEDTFARKETLRLQRESALLEAGEDLVRSLVRDKLIAHRSGLLQQAFRDKLSAARGPNEVIDELLVQLDAEPVALTAGTQRDG